MQSSGEGDGEEREGAAGDTLMADDAVRWAGDANGAVCALSVKLEEVSALEAYDTIADTSPRRAGGPGSA